MLDNRSSQSDGPQLAEVWHRVVDPRIGLVRQVHETAGGADAPSLFIASAETRATSLHSQQWQVFWIQHSRGRRRSYPAQRSLVNDGRGGRTVFGFNLLPG